MYSRDNIRCHLSRLLLVVFLSMQAVMAFHTHEGHARLIACEQCDAHVPHPGHWSSMVGDGHDCFVCQLLANSFILPLVCCILSAGSAWVASFEIRKCLHLRKLSGCISLRAPPVFSFFSSKK